MRLGPECFPNFVQATAFNKNLIMHYVNSLDEPKGQANFEVALRYAFQTFEEVPFSPLHYATQLHLYSLRFFFSFESLDISDIVPPFVYSPFRLSVFDTGGNTSGGVMYYKNRQL